MQGALEIPRLRQVAIVVGDFDHASAEVERKLGVKDPFHDPEIITFGLRNSVYPVGDTFLELVSPVRHETTAGRYLERRGGDAGYMAIFQVQDMASTRRRLQELRVRVVWQADLDGISGTHLHPRDVPGAIVSLDAAEPPESWRWAGPRWTGAAPEHEQGGIRALTVAALEPEETMQRWAAVLGLEHDTPHVSNAAPTLKVGDGRQLIAFTKASDRNSEGIVAMSIELSGPQCELRMGEMKIELLSL